MKYVRWLLSTILALAFTLATTFRLNPTRIAYAQDPAYVDISGHWANRYITTLWEEEITNGYLYSYWAVVNGRYQQLTIAYYFPDSAVTRAQYVTMLAKTFRLQPFWDRTPTFMDVPRHYALFGQTPVFGYIEAAAARQIALGDGTGRFKPDSPTSREQAIALLCRSLGLSAFAQSLSTGEVDRILSFFRDAHQVSASFRSILAAAVRLKIVEGYPDRTLRPQVQLTRAEAATLIYRSCMLQLGVDPAEFSPDGDGFEDTTLIEVGYLKNRNYTSWAIWVEDSAGSTVCVLSQSTGAQPPASLSWNGIGIGGPVPDGVYFLKGRVTDTAGQVFSCPARPVYVLRNTLHVVVEPPVAAPGETFKLVATVASHANSVRAKACFCTGVVEIPLQKSNQTTWTATLTVPSLEPDGTVNIECWANYPKTIRKASVQVSVFEPLIITGSITPNPTRAGGTVQLHARCNTAASRVWAVILGELVEFAQNPLQEGWEARWTVPPNTPVGQYQVTFWGASRRKTASTDLTLVIEGNILEQIVITLTD